MDMSDVYYDKFLLAGNPRLDLSQYKPGERLRLCIINGSASSHFYLQYAGGKWNWWPQTEWMCSQ